MKATVASTVLALLLTGCGSGVTPSAAPEPLTNSARPVLAKFVIRLPKHHRNRHAHFVSPSTQAVSLTVDPGPHQRTVATDLGSTSCTAAACTLVVSLAQGAHALNVTTYDARLSGGVPQGNVLSQNLGFPFTVRVGAANAIAVTLEGIPRSFIMTAPQDQDVTGDMNAGFNLWGTYRADGVTAYPRTFNVFAFDADGNAIVGPGAPLLTMTSGDTSTFSNGVAGISPNSFTVTPLKYKQYPDVAFTLSATPSTANGSNSGAAPISTHVYLRFAADVAPRIFITDQSTSGFGKLWVFDELGNPVPTVQAKIDAAPASLAGPDGVAYCPTYGVFVASEFSQNIYAFDTDGSLLFTQSTTKTPLSLYCDVPDRRLYVGNDSDVVTVYLLNPHSIAPIATSGTWYENNNAPPVNPWGIYANSSDVWVTDAARKTFELYDTNGNPIIESSGYSSGLFGITQLSGESWFTFTERDASAGNPALGAISATISNPSYPGGFPNLAQPFGITQDPANGYVYIVNWGSGPDGNYKNASPVVRYDTGGYQIPLPAGAFAGPDVPLDLVVVP